MYAPSELNSCSIFPQLDNQTNGHPNCFRRQNTERLAAKLLQKQPDMPKHPDQEEVSRQPLKIGEIQALSHYLMGYLDSETKQILGYPIRHGIFSRCTKRFNPILNFDIFARETVLNNGLQMWQHSGAKRPHGSRTSQGSLATPNQSRSDEL